MLKLIFNKDDSFLFQKKTLASSRGASQENDAKFKFAIHPQGIRQFHDNCKMPDCCHIGASLMANIRPETLQISFIEIINESGPRIEP